jgi:hypothetical protein
MSDKTLLRRVVISFSVLGPYGIRLLSVHTGLSFADNAKGYP